VADAPIFVATTPRRRQIRLTQTVWRKIQREHPEFQGSDYAREVRKAIEDPDYLLIGWEGADLALRWCETAPGKPKHISVVYRELDGEGFVITAFFVSRYQRLLNRGIRWQRT
jgi:hypothetical protein